MPKPLATTLPNGVRVFAERIEHVRSVAVGLWCHTGSQNERPGEFGFAHLFEHMAFKGTPTRSAKDIVDSIEGRGGSLNALTDKEATCFYARVLPDDLSNAMEVLADMVFHANVDPADLELEQGVVVEEIRQARDEPSDHVHELHVERCWPDHPLGRPISGTEESVRQAERDSLLGFVRRRYTGPNLLLSVAGYCDPEQVFREAERLLGEASPNASEPKPGAPSYAPHRTLVEDDTEQVHFCIGGPGVSVYDDDLHAVGVFDAILGGGMSSRLFQEVREKRGLAYTIASYSATLSGGGLNVVYGDTSPEKWAEVQRVVLDVLRDLTTNGPTEDELERAKRQIHGHLVISLEGMNQRMSRIARNNLLFGRTIPIDETLEKVRAVSLEDVVRAGRRVFPMDRLSVTAIGPKLEA
ncbi:MAG: insulinase family protein [Fimbriimonadales bacterium]|nr:insulinase family protein [Fimbriimonadales bacterium]